ncbi:MAG: hypothetical protein AAF487_04680 [Bacteroidota bacterium]
MAEASLHIIPDHTYSAVDLYIQENGEWRFSWTQIKKNKSELLFAKTALNQDRETFLNALKSVHPIYLFISGKGIISKLLKKEENENRVLEQLLPGSQRKLFFLESYVEEHKGIYSIIRQDVLDQIISFFKNEAFRLIDFSINPGQLTSLSSLMKEEPVLANRTHQIHLQNGRIDSLEKSTSTREYSMGEDTFSSDCSSSLALGIKNLLFNEKAQEEHEEVLAFRKEEQFRNWMQKGAMAAVIALLLAVGTNYFVQEHYAKKHQQLYSFDNVHRDNMKEVESLSKRIELKKSLIQSAGIDQVHSYSFYADQLAADLPKQIVLTQMFLSPVQKKLKANKEIEHQRDEIVIRGKIRDEQYFDEWIESLEKMDWVARVNVQAFAYSSREKTNDFHVKIKVDAS